MRRVTVFWWQGGKKVRIGELAQAKGSDTVFEWDRDFINTPFELSPLRFKKSSQLITCPQEPFENLPGLFADHIPDGWGRVLLKRGFEKQGLSFAEMSPLDMLQSIGANAMGALSFEPSLRKGEVWADGAVDLDALQEGVPHILEGTPSAVLDDFLRDGVSPNGMRPKILVEELSGKLKTGSSVSAEGSEWIVKFLAPEDSPDTAKIEYIYSQIAKDAGLRVPETRLFKGKKRHYFGTKRFDREEGQRIHTHSLSGMLHVSPGNFSVDYKDLGSVTSLLTKDIRECEQVLRLASFNTFLCNQDDHTKNVSFLMDEKGQWRLAPAYDLTFHKTRFGEHKMLCMGEGKPTLEDLRKLGETLGLKPKALLEEVKEAAARFSSYANEYDLRKSAVKEISSAIDSKLAPQKGLGF